MRFGFYQRSNDHVRVQRFLCRACQKTCSASTFSDCYQQKKRHLNGIIAKLLAGGYSQRRTAFDLGINRKTVVRKFILLGLAAKRGLLRYQRLHPQVAHMQFDDLETSIHSKCLPASITLAVEQGSRRILGFRVSQMPAKGKLAKISRAKYGHRRDDRKTARRELFAELKPLLSERAIIFSDMNPHYKADVAEFFPLARYKTTKGRRGCVVGQGELKRGGYDPLFSLNHTFAMLRANMNRLFRRTWCTTKKIERLELHVALYAVNHNCRLLQK